MNKEDVKNLAGLVRISINKDEAEEYLRDFDSILGYVDQIQAVPNPPMADGQAEHFNKNTMREDDNAMEAGTNTENLLDEAPETEKGFYKTDKIL